MKSARGFSMIELMIAIVIGLVVTDALVAMFVSVRTAARTTEGVAGLSDSGRYALDTIEQVVRGAGNLACNSSAPIALPTYTLDRIVNNLDTGVGTPLLANYDQPVAGYEAVGSAPGDAITIYTDPAAQPVPGAGGWVSTPALGGNLDGLLVTPPTPAGQLAPVGTPIAGSDILVVHATLPGSKPAYATQDASGAPQFNISSTTTFAGANQVAVISNCAQAELFQVGGFGGSLVNLAGASGPGNVSGSLSPDMSFPIGAQVDPVDVTAFYIGIGADGDGALFKYDGNGGVLGGPYAANQELVPDVESMQILYGVATSSNQTAAQYVTADKVAADSFTTDFNGVISVKVALLVASPPSTVPKSAAGLAPALQGTTWTLSAADSRMRKVYEQTMYLRNMAP